MRSPSIAAAGSSKTRNGAEGRKVRVRATRMARPRMSRVEPDKVVAVCPSTLKPSPSLVTRDFVPRISEKYLPTAASTRFHSRSAITGRAARTALINTVVERQRLQLGAPGLENQLGLLGVAQRALVAVDRGLLALQLVVQVALGAALLHCQVRPAGFSFTQRGPGRRRIHGRQGLCARRSRRRQALRWLPPPRSRRRRPGQRPRRTRAAASRR